MKLFAVATLALGAAWPFNVFSGQETGWPLVTEGPNGDPRVWWQFVANEPKGAPAVWWQFVANEPKGAPAVWWQFVTNGPNGERQVSPHFANEEECNRALKAVEALLAKRFPDRYPLVGSCESYR